MLGYQIFGNCVGPFAAERFVVLARASTIRNLFCDEINPLSASAAEASIPTTPTRENHTRSSTKPAKKLRILLLHGTTVVQPTVIAYEVSKRSRRVGCQSSG